jgi:endonuclease/exonuclease/phosphatase family metal-dependent hydrolase
VPTSEQNRVPAPLPLHVASFNIRYARADDGDDSWPLRRAATAAELEHVLTWDIAGLQEVLAEALDYLLRTVTHHQVVSAGRDDGVRAGEHCTVLVRDPAWTVESHEVKWLSTTPDVPGSVGWDADLTRIVTLVRLRHTSGVRLGFANAHFDHAGAKSRVGAAELIAGTIEAEDDRPWVFVGDLNTEPGSDALRVFAERGWTSALADDAGPTCHSFGGRDHGQIDHILFTPGLRLVDAGIDHTRPDGRYPSDHYPVWASLQFQPTRTV